MQEYKYSRVAINNNGWKRPHGGRLGGTGYVGMQGFGHEDWNFSNDVWKDGRYHLYLHQTPAGFKNGRFNFVLGAYAAPIPMVVGFVENATYGVSELPEQALHRRAQEIFALNGDHSLGPQYAGQNVKTIENYLKQDTNLYRISVNPQDLHIMVQPVPVPSDIYKVSFPGYRALSMTKDEYNKIKERVLLTDTKTAVTEDEDTSFPEGILVERLHRSRERNRRLVKLAKQKFIDSNGKLFCEICGLEPEKHFDSIKMRNRIIEAHHDVALSDDRHQGETKVSDLKMVCPTCHRAIHTIRPWLTAKELRNRLRR